VSQLLGTIVAVGLGERPLLKQHTLVIRLHCDGSERAITFPDTVWRSLLQSRGEPCAMLSKMVWLRGDELLSFGDEPFRWYAPVQWAPLPFTPRRGAGEPRCHRQELRAT
jgi:hypothetical protein